ARRPSGPWYVRGVTIDRFIEDRRARWARLGQLVSAARGRVARLSADAVVELGRLYRVTTSDLALARRDFARDVATERLNDLVAGRMRSCTARRRRAGDGFGASCLASS